MAIVDDYKIGNTRIIIDDEFCVKQTEEQKDEIIRRITKVVSLILNEQSFKIEM